MVIWGICIGVLFADIIPPVLFEIEPFLKSFALIVILLRAGLGINRHTLKQAGITAVLMAFLPCIIEGTALTIAVYLLFDFDLAVAGLTGFMLAAVSPAVIVPSMLNLKNQGYGRKNEVPTIILAGASVDDVFAITVFTVFLQFILTETFEITDILFSIPLALVTGIIPGLVIGFLLVWMFKRKVVNVNSTEKTLLLLMISVTLVQVGDLIHSASLLGVMTVGFILLEKQEKIAHELSGKLSSLWIVAEITLFVLIGITVDPVVAWGAGLRGLLVIVVGMLFRSSGVLISTIWSDLSFKERLFCVIAYSPKATVQAALGGVALSMGIEEGETILAIAVLAIIFTAPLGLIGIKFFGKKLLDTDFSD
ncbi:NhaP-type Na+(K+)/H+ antiporter [Chitinispirillum alkaliphilum]|nr:NhaP-type Na+(K+)/H+ antiporter [Chitinispirillum alkaliphilum]